MFEFLSCNGILQAIAGFPLLLHELDLQVALITFCRQFWQQTFGQFAPAWLELWSWAAGFACGVAFVIVSAGLFESRWEQEYAQFGSMDTWPTWKQSWNATSWGWQERPWTWHNFSMWKDIEKFQNLEGHVDSVALWSPIADQGKSCHDKDDEFQAPVSWEISPAGRCNWEDAPPVVQTPENIQPWW